MSTTAWQLAHSKIRLSAASRCLAGARLAAGADGGLRDDVAFLSDDRVDVADGVGCAYERGVAARAGVPGEAPEHLTGVVADRHASILTVGAVVLGGDFRVFGGLLRVGCCCAT